MKHNRTKTENSAIIQMQIYKNKNKNKEGKTGI